MTSWWVTQTDKEFTARYHEEVPRLVRETYGKPSPMIGDEIVVTNYSRLGFPKSNRAFDGLDGPRFDLTPHARGARAKGAKQGYIQDLVDFESMGW